MMRTLSIFALALLASLGCGDSDLRDVTWKAIVSLDRDEGLLADGQDAAVVTVRLEHSTGRSMKDVVVAASVEGEGAALDWPERTDAQGVVVGRLSSTVPGVKTLSFVVHVDGEPRPLEQRPAVSFVDAQAVRLSFVSSPTSTTADGALDAARVVLLDRLDRVAKSSETTIALELIQDDAAADVEGDLSCRTVNGECVFEGLFVRRAGSGYRLRASAEGVQGALGDAFDISPGRVSASRSSAVAPVAEAPADGVGSARVRVTLRDAFDNPVPGVAPAAELSPATPGDVVGAFAPSDGSGVSEADVSVRRSGAREVEVVADGVVVDDHPTLVFLPAFVLDGHAVGVRGDGLVVRLESGGATEELAISTSGSFAFEHLLDEGDEWSVSIAAVPPELVCFISTSEGRMTARLVRPTVRCGRRWMEVAEGQSFTTALTDDGKLWAWGTLSYDAYDFDERESTSVPIELAPGETFTRVAAGAIHAVAIHADGSLWTWGDNANRQLGDATDGSRPEPARVGPPDRRFVDVAAGRHHSLALAEDGSLWGWGWNRFGQLGDGTTTDVDAPTLLSNMTFKAMAAGDIHSLGVLVDGSLWGWGANGGGELAQLPGSVTRPTSLGVDDIESVSAGVAFSILLKSDGTLWGLGRNSAGQLGNQTPSSVSSPARVGPSGVTFERVSAGNEHVLALDREGTLWSWGKPTWGMLGRTGPNDEPLPVGTGFKSASAGTSASAGIRVDGSLWTWGGGGLGHPGDGTSFRRQAPRRVGDGFTQVFARAETSYALKTDGTLWSFGANESGQLGDGTTRMRSVPTYVGDDFRTLSAGSGTALALKNDGSLWGWGDNRFHAFGPDAALDAWTPMPLLSDERFQSIATGEASLAVKEDGTLLAWGMGPVGDGTSGTHLTPVELGAGYAQVAAGARFSLAFGDDGRVASWGTTPPDGEPSTERLEPLGVDFGDASLAQVAAGAYSGFAIDDDGRLWVWGDLAYDSSGAKSKKPLEMQLPLPVQAVAGGWSHALALLDDGSVWGWGHNACAQLDADLDAPVTQARRIQLPGDVVSIAAGHEYSLAVGSDGALWGWGCNLSGQLGIGRSTIEPLFVGLTD